MDPIKPNGEKKPQKVQTLWADDLNRLADDAQKSRDRFMELRPICHTDSTFKLEYLPVQEVLLMTCVVCLKPSFAVRVRNRLTV